MAMTKREALEKCKDQWQHIHAQLENYAVMAESPGVRIEIGMYTLKQDYFRDEETPPCDIPVNRCFLCQYVMDTTHTKPCSFGLKCSKCPLAGYAWSQCQDDPDSLYRLCGDAIERYDYKEAAKHAQTIVEACARAIADLTEEV